MAQRLVDMLEAEELFSLMQRMHDYTPLMQAVSDADEKEFHRLVQDRVELHRTNRCGNSALHIAALLDRPAMARRLIQEGVGLDLKDNLERTALETAVTYNQVSSVLVIVEYDTNIELALQLANELQHGKVIAILEAVALQRKLGKAVEVPVNPAIHHKQRI